MANEDRLFSIIFYILAQDLDTIAPVVQASPCFESLWVRVKVRVKVRVTVAK